MDKKKIYKKGKPKRTYEVDNDSNSPTTSSQAKDTSTTEVRKKILRLAGVQLGATSTDPMVTKGNIGDEIFQAESTSSSGHSLTMGCSIEKTKHVSFEDFRESQKSSSSSSSRSQSKSSQMSLRNEQNVNSGTAALIDGANDSDKATPGANRTILKKRKKNAKRRAKKVAMEAMLEMKAVETENSNKLQTEADKKTTSASAPKLRFADEALQIAERPKAQQSCSLPKQEMKENPAIPENLEIAERFKQIMDMFDNFTKNLESLDLPPSAEVEPKALTKKIRRHPAIPLGWKDDGRENKGSNIEITITESNDKKKDSTIIQNKEIMSTHTTLKDAKKNVFQADDVKKAKTELKTAMITESQIQPTLPQRCEVKDWQTGVQENVLKEFEIKTTEPKLLRTLAQEKIIEKTTNQANNLQGTDSTDVKIEEPQIKNDSDDVIVEKIEAPLIDETKITSVLPCITAIEPTEPIVKTDELQKVNIQTESGERESFVDGTSKPNVVKTKETEEIPTIIPTASVSTDFVIDMEDNAQPERDFLSEEFEIWKMHQNAYPHGLPKWRQGLQNLVNATAVKTQQPTKITTEPAVLNIPLRKDNSTSTALDKNTTTILSESAELPCQTVSCQTSHHLHTAATATNTTSLAHSVTVDSLIDETDCKVQTYLLMPPADENKTCGTLGPSISRQALVKESPSLLDLPRVTAITQQPERTFHTIHIDTTSTPSPSVMQRPPLFQRFWTIITDLFSAICVCLQVNKDCIFCLGFFIAFVVSASFLTAFFYRTLSVTPQIYQAQPPQTPPLLRHPQIQQGSNLNYY